MKWVQDVAIAHWTSLATKEILENNLWVVSRHEIDYLKSAMLDSKLIAKTWVGEPDRAKSTRYVNICDANTDVIYAKIKTTWYLLDAKSKRPKRIDEEMMKLFY